ncbi:hypothetical protein AB1N83_006413 [Pleurotus pulmonarius]
MSSQFYRNNASARPAAARVNQACLVYGMHPSAATPTSAHSLASNKSYIYDYNASNPDVNLSRPTHHVSSTQLTGSLGNTPTYTNPQPDRPRLLYSPQPSKLLGPSPLIQSTFLAPLSSPTFQKLVNFPPPDMPAITVSSHLFSASSSSSGLAPPEASNETPYYMALPRPPAPSSEPEVSVASAKERFPRVEELGDPRDNGPPASKAKKGRVPPPVNTMLAAALPGPECNITIVQDDSKVGRYRVGDHVQVRRWDASKSTYGPWKPATVHDRVHPAHNATGPKQRLYVVALGDRICREMFDPGLGEITRYNAAEIYATPDPQYDHYGVVFALVISSVAKDRKAGILMPGQRTREEPWKVRVLVGPRAGYDYQTTFTIPYTRRDAARAQAHGLELFGDGTPEFMRSHGFFGPLGDN